MGNCYNCKHANPECEDWCWYITCEKDLEISDFGNNCTSFEPIEDIKIDFSLPLISKHFHQECSCTLQGATLRFKDANDLKVGDTFVITKMYRSSNPDVLSVELEKVYKYNG